MVYNATCQHWEDLRGPANRHLPGTTACCCPVTRGGGGPVQTATEHDKFTPHSAGSHTATRLPDTTTAVRFRRVTEGENAQPFEKAIKVPLPFLTVCLREARFPCCTSPKTTYHTQKRMLEWHENPAVSSVTFIKIECHSYRWNFFWFGFHKSMLFM